MGNTVIRTEGLERVYQMGKTKVRALRGVDFSVERGEMIAIMGASGSGKSTLMNILGCLDLPTSGTYHLDDVRVDKLSRNELADIRNTKIGFVFQGFNLLARTSATANVELPLLYDRSGKKINSKERAARALEKVGLGERLDHEPSELSGGQQQRVAIARALVTDPAIILADEPTGNLDSKTGEEVLELMKLSIKKYHQTLVMITHDEDVAKMADKVIRIEDGKLVNRGGYSIESNK